MLYTLLISLSSHVPRSAIAMSMAKEKSRSIMYTYFSVGADRGEYPTDPFHLDLWGDAASGGRAFGRLCIGIESTYHISQLHSAHRSTPIQFSPCNSGSPRLDVNTASISSCMMKCMSSASGARHAARL